MREGKKEMDTQKELDKKGCPHISNADVDKLLELDYTFPFVLLLRIT